MAKKARFKLISRRPLSRVSRKTNQSDAHLRPKWGEIQYNKLRLHARTNARTPIQSSVVEMFRKSEKCGVTKSTSPCLMGVITDYQGPPCQSWWTGALQRFFLKSKSTWIWLPWSRRLYLKSKSQLVVLLLKILLTSQWTRARLTSTLFAGTLGCQSALKLYARQKILKPASFQTKKLHRWFLFSSLRAQSPTLPLLSA